MVNKALFLDRDGTINVDTQELQKSAYGQFGVVMVDGSTIKSNSGLIYVDTQALVKSDTDTFGISIGDNSTIVTSAGKISLSQYYVNRIEELTNTVDKLSALLKQPTASISSFDNSCNSNI